MAAKGFISHSFLSLNKRQFCGTETKRPWSPQDVERLIRILARQAVHEAVASTPESNTDLTRET